MGECRHNPGDSHALLQEDGRMQQPMTRSLLHTGVGAIVRMSSTRTNYWVEVGVDIALGTVLIIAGWRHHAGSALTAALAIMLGLYPAKS